MCRPPTLAEAALTGRRYSGPEALGAGIARESLPEAAVVWRAIEIAEELANKNRKVLRAHKKLLYADAIALCG
jgi:enoyl-CoA hydratase/carnithine racemase